MKPFTVSLIALSFTALVGCAQSTANTQKTDEAPTQVTAELQQSILNFSHPSPHLMAGGQPKMSDFAALNEAGVSAVINFRSHPEMRDIHEAQWTTAQQMAYYHIPIAGADDLSEENVARLHQTLAANAQQNVFMHCASSNRVGAMMALRAAWHQGASKEEALAIGEQYGLGSLRKHVEQLLSE
ncbi:fused DSP-PTPase phosphatase/NAD kinase-like protein [Pseudidiomarina sediminum]|uniref:fused DSP-PTPase phosphatase/NAD kinase-like protein n=1 Tax=Pseudidiomarina sediminum TaxID=431675 RepID=UPI001C98B992|nr:sulfur transferase domain-containing protein [Pseudidiomarina sediminum]MBY6064414.1 serine/threonine protein phosphatase [Pseudidiomarina sediminum]